LEALLFARNTVHIKFKIAETKPCCSKSNKSVLMLSIKVLNQDSRVLQWGPTVLLGKSALCFKKSLFQRLPMEGSLLPER
jgi:hypothetical protein